METTNSSKTTLKSGNQADDQDKTTAGQPASNGSEEASNKANPEKSQAGGDAQSKEGGMIVTDVANGEKE